MACKPNDAVIVVTVQIWMADSEIPGQEWICGRHPAGVIAASARRENPRHSRIVVVHAGGHHAGSNVQPGGGRPHYGYR